MIHISHKTLATLLVAASLMACGRAAAQDVVVDFESLFAAGQTSPYTIGDVTFTYCAYDKGADIYLSENDYFSLKVNTTGRNIVRIEITGETAAERYNDEIVPRSGNGRLTHLQSGTFVWEGCTTSLQLWGTNGLTNYYVKSLRLWYEGSEIITDEKQLCATPDVTVADGQIIFSCATPDATYHYTVLPVAADPDPAATETVPGSVAIGSVTITLHATAPGTDPSEHITKTFPLTDF